MRNYSFLFVFVVALPILSISCAETVVAPCAGVDCSDGNECTSDVCTDGSCSNPAVADGASCDGGNGSCQGGVCQSVTPLCVGVDCSDGNECTSDVCTDGNCSNPASANGTLCDGGNGLCQGGTCIANPAVPNAPTNLRITGTTDIFSDLAFTDNSGNEDGFLVYANGGLFRTLGPNETIFQAGPPCGSTYQIFVAAQNAVGESAPTATVDVEGVCTTVHRIFISSVTFAPNLGSLANADSRCQMLATGQSLGGTWRAVLANSSTPVENRITVAGRVENLAGELVASDAVDFFDGVAQNAVDIDETGDAPADTVAWVGNSTNNCLNWTSTSTNDFGQQALATRLDGWLYGRSSGPCNLMRSLYCISQ